MNTIDPRPTTSAFVQSSRALVDAFAEDRRQGARGDGPPLDKERERLACAPMGTLHSIVASVDKRRRRRFWYVIEPDAAIEHEYRALGLPLFPGCKILVDAEFMKPVAVLDLDPSTLGPGVNSPLGFNPYFDLPGG